MDCQPDGETEFEGTVDIGSFNHGYIQIRLASLVDQLGKFTIVGSVTLDVDEAERIRFDLPADKEIQPDISLYEKRGLSRPFDILKMKEMPLVVMEILSPIQGTYDLINEFGLCFELGVHSCWLVNPTLATVTVFRSADHYRTFSGGEIYDEPTGIRLPIEDIFS